MTDKRRAPPAYLCYASDDLASSKYFALSCGERGLLDAMNRVWWIERRLPKSPSLLARVVRLDVGEVAENLTSAVLSHFVVDVSDPDVLHSVELQRQFSRVIAIREKQAIGGAIGAAMTNAARTTRRRRRKGKQEQAPAAVAGRPASQGAGQGASRPASPEQNRTEQNRTEQNRL
jgi:hypothetical protein